MRRRISPMPAHFLGESEKDYWHTAQDIAYRIGASLVERDGSSWLVSDDGERLLVSGKDSACLWYSTYLILDREYPEASRLWFRGRAEAKPGEMHQRKPPST